MIEFRGMLFSTIVPNLKRLGLLTPRVRTAMEDLGVIQYEHADAGDAVDALADADSAREAPGAEAVARSAAA
jgi:hypothetical protein